MNQLAFKASATAHPKASMTRLGAISFINTLPVYHALPLDNTTPLHYATPSQLNAAMFKGELEVSPVSSAFYLQNREQFVLLDNLSVSSYGAVESVLFISTKPLDPLATFESLWDASIDHIAVPDTSATSVALLNHYLTQASGHSWLPHFKIYPASMVWQALRDYGNVLVIGDTALEISRSPVLDGYFVHDLASLWQESHGLPFVFAVWVAQKQWAQANPERLAALNAQLVASRQQFFSNNSLAMGAVQKAVALHPELTSQQVHRYFSKCLNFELTEAHRQSLEHFAQLLAAQHAEQTSVACAS